MAACGYSLLVGGNCGAASSNPQYVQCVAVDQCSKNIKSHLRSYRVFGDNMQGDISEAKLLLARAGVFGEQDSSGLSICPRHRDAFGIRWKSNKKRCAVPKDLSSHTSFVKGDRGVTFRQSKKIFKLTGILIPIASPICRHCRKTLDEPELVPQEGQVQEQPGGTHRPVCGDDPNIIDDLCNAVHNLSLQEISTYNPSAEDSHSTSNESSNGSQSNVDGLSIQRQKLNEFLYSCGESTFIGPYKKQWDTISGRTRKSHVAKAKSLVVAGLNVIAPGDAASLWEALRESKSIERQLGLVDESPEEQRYLSALAESYHLAFAWETRRQVLSIMADLVPLSRIQRYIPGLTEYRYNMARQHSVQYGRGVQVTSKKSPRMRLDDKQLDHFLLYITSPHVTQDLPFGQKYLRLSSGETLETPNIIRSMIPSRLVKQYLSYCEETNFKPFGTTTMLRILEACSATVRKSQQGLDYLAADGAKGFDDLYNLIDRVKHGYLSQEVAKSWQTSLKECKQYLKADYKVHISNESHVRDHCINFALNDTKDSFLTTSCTHEHNEECKQCNNLKTLLLDMENFLSTSSQFSQEEMDDLMYIYKQSAQAIELWKAHQLRSVVQDQARTTCLDSLDHSAILVTQDWAMKFLPMKYRESQTSWFGKRGISWHISVVVRKVEGKFQSQSFVHIVENCSQDTSAVVRILEHTLCTVKTDHPEITTAYIRQDNAGCYHNSIFLATCMSMQKRTGIHVRRVDFSDPQGGKGACDRKAAAIKANVRRFINEGNDVQNGDEFRKAMLSSGGISGLRVACVDGAASKCDLPDVKWEGVSTFNNFLYTDEGVTAWRAFNIGKGKFMKKGQEVADYLNNCCFTSTFSPGDFVMASEETSKKDIQRRVGPPALARSSDLNSPSDELFSCPNEGCVKMYRHFSGLDKHLSFGKCKLMVEKESLLDKAKRQYHALLTSDTGPTSTCSITLQSQANASHLSAGVEIPEGWALKSTRKSARFTEKQKAFLDEKFNIGQNTGCKMDPETVARDMRFAKKIDDSRLFSGDEFLNAQQIQSYFSRMSAKLRHATISEQDTAAAQDADSFDQTRQQVIETVQLNHPIMYENLDLCKMFKTDTLKKVNITLLKSICEYYDIEVENFNQKRKAQFLSTLGDLVQTCQCFKK